METDKHIQALEWMHKVEKDGAGLRDEGGNPWMV